MPRPLVQSRSHHRIPAPGAITSTLPATQAPQLATAADNPPDGDEWVSEIKLDGYRLLVWLDRGRARLVTRAGHDWTPRLPRLTARFAALGATTALLDGEMVALRADGTSSFPDLQAALSDGADAGIFFQAFDLLHLDGWDLRACALRDRKRQLEAVPGWGGMIRYADHVDGQAAALHRQAGRLGLEGIIAKQADAPYRPGRSSAWLKVKCLGRDEFVVLGWTPPSGSRRGIGALALGFYDASRHLHYAGLVGTGFTDRELQAMRTRLEAMPPIAPTALLVAGEAPDRAIRWITPDLVAEVSYTTWTGDGRLRHGGYLGLREDKPARDVVMAVPEPQVVRRSVQLSAIPGPSSHRKPRWTGAVPPVRHAGRIG